MRFLVKSYPLRTFDVAALLIILIALFMVLSFQSSNQNQQANKSLPNRTLSADRSEGFGSQTTKSAAFVSSPSTDHSIQTLRNAYGRLPMSFEVNQGQTDTRVKFLARGSAYSLFLTSSEAVLALRTATGNGSNAEPMNGPQSFNPACKSQANGQTKTLGGVLRQRLIGANLGANIKGVDKLPGNSNYFFGKDSARWQRDISNYARVKYENVYRGVDLVYYGSQGELEYDFVVAPYANYKQIKLQYKGAKRIRIDKTSGDVILTTKSGDELHQRKPTIYQDVAGERLKVQGTYELNRRREIAFRIEEYDISQPLVIDPTLVYSTYLGGSSDDQAFAITVDAQGNAYVTGETSSTNFPTQNPVQATGGSSSDTFVTKLNATGTGLVYSTYLGGTLQDDAYDIVADSEGNAYVAGLTHSTDFPVQNAFQSTYGGGEDDAFVTKLNSTGNGLVYSTYIGGSFVDEAHGIAVDPEGNAYFTGETSSINFPTQNPFQATRRGNSIDAFVAKLNAAGNGLIYSTYLGGDAWDRGYDIAVDAQGAAYVTGFTWSGNFPTQNAFQANHGGGSFDAFVTKLNAVGNGLVYSTYLGGSSNDFGLRLAVDVQGSAYVTGGTVSTNFLTQSPFQATYGGGEDDAFLTKLNAVGNGLIYSTYLGGSSDDWARGITVDAQGNPYIVGLTHSTNFPTQSSFQSFRRGDSVDAFITKFNAAGTGMIYSTYLGGGGRDEAYGIAVNNQGITFIAGLTESTDFPTQSPLQPFGGGGSDVFIAKINEPVGTLNWVQKNPSNAPAVRSYHTMAYDGARGETLLFGGFGLFNSVYGDTWTWDGNNWTQKSPPNTPSKRLDSAMAFDAVRNQIVLFGGNSNSTTTFNDTWIWDGANWTQKFPVTSPSVRSGHAMTFDAGRGQVVLFGGFNFSAALNDTWVWDGTNWIQKFPANNPPARHRGNYLTYDALRNRVVLAGGDFNDTWIWDGTNWTQLFPTPARPNFLYPIVAYDAAHADSIYFGGVDGRPNTGNQTWAWDGTTWSQRFPANTPPGRIGGAMAYDTAHSQIVLFAGTENGGPAYNDTWVWATETPSPTPSPSPSPSPNPSPSPSPIPCDLSVDTDGDGLPNCWETAGVDINEDGIIDLLLPGANPNHKDVYVEIDYMVGAHSHQPMANSLSSVVGSFARAPLSNPDGTTGISLHLQLDEALPHSDELGYAENTDSHCPATDFDTLSAAFFGTSAERSGGHAQNTLAAKRRVYRYVIFAHRQADNFDSANNTCRDNGSSGRARGIPAAI